MNWIPLCVHLTPVIIMDSVFHIRNKDSCVYVKVSSVQLVYNL